MVSILLLRRCAHRWLVGLAVGVLVIALSGTVRAQGFANAIHTAPDSPADDVLISGEASVTGVLADEHWRGPGDDKELYYLAAMMRLRLDLQFTNNVQAVLGMRTPRRTTAQEFGAGPEFPRNAPGLLLSSPEEASLLLDEAAVRVNNFVLDRLDVKLGMFHLQYGLDTAVEDVSGRANDWDGHGALWLDTRTARDDQLLADTGSADIQPAGVHALWTDGTETYASLAWAWFNLDTTEPDNEVRLLAATLENRRANGFTLGGGYAVRFDGDATDIQTAFAYLWVPFDDKLAGYSELAWQFDGARGQAWVLGVRYTFPTQQAWLDGTFWYIAGDDGADPEIDEGFVGYGSLQTTAIVNSLDVGLGRQRNYSAQVVVFGYNLTYGLDLRGVVALYQTLDEATGPDPGNEVDLAVVYRLDAVRIEALGAYLFDSDLLPGDDKGALFLLRTVFTF